ncbi:MAG TPA: glycosyltransferase family 39 protein [Tepidisphaeraceae bacterium]|nr:glycosyltransferase family 39 protein [Tepidisphaeraceae bacterium]
MTSSPPPRPALSPSARLFAACVLLALGLQWWAGLTGAYVGDRRQKILIAGAVVLTAVLVAVRPARRALIAVCESLRCPRPWARRATAVVLVFAAGAYLYQTARWADRPLVPLIHDENSYAVQARMLAEGRLWLPRADFYDSFETFHVFTDPVYASKYCAGASIFFAAAYRLGLEPWMASLALASLSVGLIYLIFTRLIDGVAGLLAALALPGLIMFRRVSVEVLSQAPILFLLLLAFWAFLKWRQDRALGWMIVISVAIGWGAITRPVEAVSMAVPLAVAVLLSFRGLPRGRAIFTLAVGLLCLVPFASLQLIQNKGVTGHLTGLPWVVYAQKFDPYDRVGATAPPTDARPQTHLAQKQKFVATFTAQQYKAKAGVSMSRRLLDKRLIPTLNLSLPHLLLIALVPLGFLGLATKPSDAHGAPRCVRLLPIAFLAIFLLLYTQYTFYIAHYAVPAMPAVLLLMLAGWDALARALPAPLGAGARAASALLIAGLTLSAYPQIAGTPRAEEEWEFAGEFVAIDRQVNRAIGAGPALVLFKYHDDANEHVEPVYNTATARPEAGRVVRAHDLGDAGNRALLVHFAKTDPARKVYRYDRDPAVESAPITYLGTAGELAARMK